MPHKTGKKQKEKSSYSYSEYLTKFRPHRLPDAPRTDDPSSEEIAEEIVKKALQRVRNRSGNEPRVA